MFVYNIFGMKMNRMEINKIKMDRMELSCTVSYHFL